MPESIANLHLMGFSHRVASVAVRERYAVSQDDVEGCLRDLAQADDIAEVWVLSTCNRTEVLALAKPGRDPRPVIKGRVFRNLDAEHLYEYQGTQAIIHLFRVAGGLDSLVLGESEILGQVKQAFEHAQSAKTIGKLLTALLKQTLQVGKRVRRETEIGQGTLSVARVGVGIAKRIYGNFESHRALIIGAGETGRLVARHLASEGLSPIDFANRTLARAEEAATEFAGRAYGLAGLPEALKNADIVMCCVEGLAGVVHAGLFDRKWLRARHQPQLLIDLSVPRAVHADVAQLPNLLSYDLDNLEPVIDENRKSRSDAIEQSAEILVSEVHKFIALRTYASFSPAIARLRERFEAMREEVIDHVAGERTEPREVQLAHELTRRLLDVALDQMKEGARGARSEEALDAEYQRFLENL